MRSARPGPSLWADMHKLATAPRSSSASTSARTSPAAAAASRSVRMGGPKSPVEVTRQAVERRISRVQSLGEPTFGCDEGRIALHPSRQRLAWLVPGSQNRRGVRAGIDFTT